MAIINKEKHLREIASLVQKGTFEFEPEDRPAIRMGGREVFISSVGYDFDAECLTFNVSNAAGDILPSAYSVRPLAALDVKTLSAVGGKVRQYSSLRVERERNQVNIESRLSTMRRNRSALGL